MSTDHADRLPRPASVLERVLGFSVRQRGLVVIATAGIAALGLFNFRRLPIDAVPDITNVQVQINTVVEALSPVEVEKQVTFPIETAMSGLPSVEHIRSLSRYGLSQVTVVFRDGTDIYFARQLVSERLQQAREALGRSPPASARCSCGRSRPLKEPASRTARRTRPWTCARSRTGS
jgi:Cu/Ag efflux pump CusA